MVTVKNGNSGGITPEYSSTNSTRAADVVDSVAHGTYHMADSPQFYEPQRLNNFEFIVTDLDNLTNMVDGSKISDAQEILRLSVSAASIPHFSQNVIEIKRGNSSIKYAGTPTFKSGSLTINDYIGCDSIGILSAWQKLSYNVKTEKVGLVSSYKKDCYLIEYAPDMQKVRTYRIHGCWISNLDESQFNSDSGNSKNSITVTIEYDRAEIDSYGDN